MGIFSLALVFGFMFLSACKQEPDPVPPEYTVTFDRNDGGTTASTTKKVKENETVDALPDNPTRTDGYVFASWNTAKDGSGTSFTAATKVTDDITVYAQWTPTGTVPGGTYTVTFDSDGGSAVTAQNVNAGANIATLPANPTKAGYEFDGWYTEKNGGGAQFTAATTVTANITVYAKWKVADPFIGGIWLDRSVSVHYKFADISGEKVYSTATGTTFNPIGTYEYTATELTLRPTTGSPQMFSYEIDKSLLYLNKGQTGQKRYTKNPETGGGFNGALGPAPLGGMWQNTAETEIFGFNNDGEYFETSIKNRDGKYWWDVYGTYEYNAARNELILRSYGYAGETSGSTIYTVEFITANQVMNLTRPDGVTIRYNKRDGL
ncbi:hypothetical protein Holit_01244 [Hollandina sp. SP2]